MRTAIPGLHHVTAISGPPQASVDFYTRTSRQRLVKRTVNFDDPGNYHLYCGDRTGSPGTILTFFPFVDADPGRAGTDMGRCRRLCRHARGVRRMDGASGTCSASPRA